MWGLAPTRTFLCRSRLAIFPYPRPRHIHLRKELPYPIENGLGDFLSPAALRTLAEEYQQGLLDRLSDEVKGTEQENKSVAQTVIDTSPDRTKTLAFNYASLALNNSFFLDYLKPPPADANNNEDDMSEDLKITIRDDFGSLDQFKSTFSAAAMGLSSSGWVWFVMDDAGYTAVVPTFGAGTLLVRSRTMVSPGPSIALGESIGSQGSGPKSTPNQTQWRQPPPTSIASGLTRPPIPSVPQNPTTPPFRSLYTTPVSAFPRVNIYDAKPVGIHGRTADGEAVNVQENVANFHRIGVTLYPLFCLSVYEHAWLSSDYGIWGKEEYLKKFWTVVDWKKVSEAFQKFSPSRVGRR